MPTGINQFQLIERVLIQTDDARHSTLALRERAELPLQHFKKKIPARSVVLEPPGKIRRSSPAREIRRSSSAQRDASFLCLAPRYNLLTLSRRYIIRGVRCTRHLHQFLIVGYRKPGANAHLQLQHELKLLREYGNYFATPDTNAHTHFAIGKTRGG